MARLLVWPQRRLQRLRNHQGCRRTSHKWHGWPEAIFPLEPERLLCRVAVQLGTNSLALRVELPLGLRVFRELSWRLRESVISAANG